MVPGPAYVGSIQNLKDLTDLKDEGPTWYMQPPLYPWTPTPPDRAAGPPPPKVHMHTTDSHPAKFSRQRSSSDSVKVKKQIPATNRQYGNPAADSATPPPETRSAQ